MKIWDMLLLILYHQEPNQILLEFQPTLDFGVIGNRTESAFLTLADYVGALNSQPPFANANDAVIWLNTNGYWTNFTTVTPTPTATLGVSPTPTPTLTQTPTSTDLSTITTYTVSGCTSSVSYTHLTLPTTSRV